MKQTGTNRQKSRPPISLKIQVVSSLLVSVVITINLILFTDRNREYLVYNLISNFVFVLALWQCTLIIHKWVENRFSAETQIYKRIFLSLLIVYLVCVLVTVVMGSILYFIFNGQWLTVDDWLKLQDLYITIFAAFLLTVVMLALITLVQHFRSTKEKLLSINEGIIESIAEGILVTDLNDNILIYNTAFKNMWLLNDDILAPRKNSVALNYAIKNVENADEIFQIITQSENKINDRISLMARMKNKRVLEGISMPQIINGKVVGRIWSNRDVTERLNAEREEIEKGVAQAQFESLKNQVNPHFLFNSLNVLSSLVHINADLSEKFIDQLARSYRYLLEQRDKELVPLKTEIEFVQSFSFLLKIRFEEKLRINIQLPAEAMNDLIAPLTLQLLIENAVKHNTISVDEPLIIDLFMDDEGYLVVKNNIQMRVQSMPSTGVGLKNIISRYKLLTNRIPEFNVLNDTYVARIPLIKAE